ncbi:Hsp20/alpha crystallin family protein [Cohnella caldifontis]|uniref:Hsp20/alpha crystallin family protein n=1 Tax=Cohnella caldifontis TaxID=3027471 RepID=UPI0023EB78AF|nr:Hsp20/alpha crystallin family protein [Cohnella sp. YIM B05605]
MPLVPYEPFRHFENMRRDLDSFFSRDWPMLPAGLSREMGLGRISVDVYETENEVVAACEIPGLEKKEDVNIDVGDNVLSISGTLNRVNEVKEENIHRQERFFGRFHRSVALPTAVSAEGVTATYKNGVLEVRMPKKKGDSKQRIDVQFH